MEENNTLLTSSFYVALAAVAPVGLIVGIIYAINAIRLDKGVPLAYAALVLNILGIIPAIYSAWLIIFKSDLFLEFYT